MPSEGERLATLEAWRESEALSKLSRHAEVDRRLSRMEVQMDRVVEATNRHCLKATCVNGGVKVLQGAGAGSGVLLMLYIILQRFGLV